MKVFFRTVHLYFSLAAGIIITCSCFTGTMLVFEKEIQNALYPERYTIMPSHSRYPLSRLIDAALKKAPASGFNSVTVYADPSRTVEVGVNSETKKSAVPDGDEKAKEVEKPDESIFVNPYSGKVVGDYTRKKTFLYTVETLHRYLVTGKKGLGEAVVDISTLLFLFVLITGLILWWPKTMKIMRQRITVKWNAGRKRLVHDLHLVTGFYTSLFLIITVLSALIMSYKWAEKGMYALTDSPVKKQSVLPKSAYHPGSETVPIDTVLHNIAPFIKQASLYTIHMPRDPEDVYVVTILPPATAEAATDSYYLDQYSGKLLKTMLFNDRILGERLKILIKPIHTGAVYGLATKIISFITCLLSLIFPVTGVMMWLNRTSKKKKKTLYNPLPKQILSR